MRYILLLIVLGLLVFALIGGWLWPYTINSWLEFAGSETRIQLWQGALMGFVPGIGQITIPLAIITWICMLFLK